MTGPSLCALSAAGRNRYSLFEGGQTLGDRYDLALPHIPFRPAPADSLACGDACPRNSPPPRLPRRAPTRAGQLAFGSVSTNPAPVAVSSKTTSLPQLSAVRDAVARPSPAPGSRPRTSAGSAQRAGARSRAGKPSPPSSITIRAVPCALSTQTCSVPPSRSPFRQTLSRRFSTASSRSPSGARTGTSFSRPPN